MNREYEYVQTVAKYGSIAKAAEHLYISPSALSKYIKKTEEYYGVPLFHRIGNAFELTDAGLSYIDFTNKINSLEKDMITTLRDMASVYTGTIRLGIMTSTADFVIPKIIPTFYKKYPNFKINIEENVNDNLIDMVKNGILDFAIIDDQNNNDPTLVKQFVSKDYNVIVVPKNDPLLEYAIDDQYFPYQWIDIRKFKDSRFIASPAAQDSYFYKDFFEIKYGFKPQIICRFKNFRTILWAVNSGMGVALSLSELVRPLVNKNNFNVEILSYGEKMENSNLVIIHRNGQYLNTATRFLMHQCICAYHD